VMGGGGQIFYEGGLLRPFGLHKLGLRREP